MTTASSANPGLEGSLKGKAIRSAVWNYAGTLARALSQFATGILLARLLSPHDFGVVAVAWIFIGLGNLFSDFGLTSALVQREKISDRDIAFCFWVQNGIGLALAAALAGFSVPIANLYQTPDSAIIVAALSSIFIIKALGQTSYALLQRQMKFREIQTIGVVSYLLAYGGLGTLLAFLGFGAWSIVAAQIGQSTICSAAYWNLARHSVSYAGPSSVIGRFGIRVVAANVLSWTVMNVDGVVIGQLFGTAALGLYNRTLTLLNIPTNAATTSLQTVLFSAISRRSTDKEAARNAFLVASFFLASACLPTFMTIAAIPDTLILGLLGAEWSDAILVAVPLALAMPIHAMLALVGPTLMARDRVGLEIVAQAVAAAWLIAGLLLFSQSLASIAWVTVSAYLVRLVFLLLVLQIELGGIVLEWLEGMARIAVGSLPAVTAGYFASSTTLSNELDLLCAILAAGFAVVVSFGAGARIFIPKRLRLAAAGAGKLPAWIQKYLSNDSCALRK